MVSENHTEPKRLPLRYAWLVYAASIVALRACPAAWDLGVPLYFVLGFLMTRYVMPRLVYLHPMWHTVNAEFWQKVLMFLFWPLGMFTLLVKLSINRIL